MNNTVDQVDQTNIQQTLHSNTAEYTFFSSIWTFSRTDNILGHKTRLKIFKNGSISSIFSDYNQMKLSISSKTGGEKMVE